MSACPPSYTTLNVSSNIPTSFSGTAVSGSCLSGSSSGGCKSRWCLSKFRHSFILFFSKQPKVARVVKLSRVFLLFIAMHLHGTININQLCGMQILSVSPLHNRCRIMLDILDRALPLPCDPVSCRHLRTSNTSQLAEFHLAFLAFGLRTIQQLDYIYILHARVSKESNLAIQMFQFKI